MWAEPLTDISNRAEIVDAMGCGAPSCRAEFERRLNVSGCPEQDLILLPLTKANNPEVNSNTVESVRIMGYRGPCCLSISDRMGCIHPLVIT